MDKLYIVIPAYNEQDNIVRLMEDVESYGYDYLVINDTVEAAVDELRAILQAEHCRPAERIEQLAEN